MQTVFSICVHLSAHCTYVDILKSYHCSTLSNVIEYALIWTISLLKWDDALVLQSAIYNNPRTVWQNLLFLYFSFDKISLQTTRN